MPSGVYIRTEKSKKQFCINNHDTSICGRDKKGFCNICKIDYHKEYWPNYMKDLNYKRR